MKKLFTLALAMGSLLAFTSQLNAQCAAGQELVDVSITTDNYGSETTWEVVDVNTGTVYGSGGPYANGAINTYDVDVCIPANATVQFIINDSYGDGICCTEGTGSYTVMVGAQTIGTGGAFGSQAAHYLTAPLNSVDAAVVAVNTKTYAELGMHDVSYTIANVGTSTLSSVDVEMEIGGTMVTDNLSGLSIAPFTTQTFTHSMQMPIAVVGPTVATATASNPNATADANAGNNSYSGTTFGLSSLPDKGVLVEEFTGTWCGWCPDGALILQDIIDNHPHAVGVAHHDGDVMEFPESAGIIAAYNDGFPTGVVDRALFNGAAAPALSRGSWEAATVQQLDIAVPAAISATSSFDEGTRVLTVEVTARFFGPIPGDFNINAILTESGIVASQANYYSSTSSGPDPSHPFYSLPNPVPDYVHTHAVRAMLGGTWGTPDVIPNPTADLGEYSHTYTYTVPASFNESKLELAVIITEDNANVNQRPVVNAIHMGINDNVEQNVTAGNPPSAINEVEGVMSISALYPNPASKVAYTEVTVVEGGDYSMQVVDMMGKELINTDLGYMANGKHTVAVNTSKMASGLYMVSITNGQNQVATQRLVVSQ